VSISRPPFDYVLKGGAMRYLMFICTDPSAEPYDPKQDNIESWVSEMDGRGVRISGNRLTRPDQAITVRKRNGKVLTTDGPFAETKEWIGGFDVIECASLDEAIEVASKHPMARFGKIEIRSFWLPD
jgi:hypothetical protein